MFLIRYLRDSLYGAWRAAPPPPPVAPPPLQGDAGAGAVHRELPACGPLAIRRDVAQPGDFAQPRPFEPIQPATVMIRQAPREAAEVRSEAVQLCRRLLSRGPGPVFTLSQAFEEMPADLRDLFLAKRPELLQRMNDPARRSPMKRVEIVSLLIGEVLALEAAGIASGVQVAGATGKVKAELQMLIDEIAGSQTSVVETEPAYVGETFHILAAAFLRNLLGAELSIKVPAMAVPDAYHRRFSALVGGAYRSDTQPLVSRASRQRPTEIPKAGLSTLMVGGELGKIGELRGMLLSGLSADTVNEIGERTRHVLRQAGMEDDSVKLGIFIRNVKPSAQAGGTQDPRGNMTRERFLDVLNAAENAGIRDIVLLGDKPEPGWLTGTPWDPLKIAAAPTRRRRGAAAAPVQAEPAHHLAQLTEPWSAQGNSPLYDGPGQAAPRQHLSMTTAYDSGPEPENSLQGGYAEQLAMYAQLHENLGMAGLVGNRCGAMDGPGFLGVPTVQMVARAPFPNESSFDRLGLLSTIIPSYRVISLESAEALRRRGPDEISDEPSHLSPGQADALQAAITNFVERQRLP